MAAWRSQAHHKSMTEIDAFLEDLDRLAAAAPTGDPGAFYGQLVPVSASALGSDAIDWVGFGRPSLSTPVSQWPKARRGGPGLLDAELLERVRHEGTPRITAAEADGSPILACPIEGPGGPAGVLAFRLTVSAASAPERSLELATAVAEVAGRYELRRAGEAVSRRESRLARIETALIRLHSQRGFSGAARRAVEEGRPLLGCDRLTAFVSGLGGWRVLAVSGVDRVSRRSNAARQMTGLVAAAMRLGLPLRVPSDRADESTHLTDLVERYRDTTGVRSLCLQPCVAAESIDGADEEAASKPSVALLAEWFDAERDSEADAMLVALSRHVGAASCREKAGVASRFAMGRLAIVALGLAFAAAAVVFAAVTPATLWVSLEGRFEPVDRARVFAPLDGVVEELLVGQAEEVAKGDPLIRLVSPELRLQQEEVAEAITGTESEIASLKTAKLQAALPSRDDRADPTALASRIASLRERLAFEERRRELLAEQARRLLVTSPIDGTVLSWRPEDRLAARPVRRGQRLLEIAGQSNWQLELDVPDHRVGHVLSANGEGSPLRMEYVVRSDPAVTHAAVVTEIAQAAHTGPDGLPVVRVVAAPEDASAANPRSGLGVSAKIDCGEHSLGYVWLHEAIEAVRRRWF